MRGADLGLMLLVGLAVGLSPVGGGTRTAWAQPAAQAEPMPKAQKKKARRLSSKRPAIAAAENQAAAMTPEADRASSGFVEAKDVVYNPSFSGSIHKASYGRFPSRINPLVSQEFPATPEYIYLYTPSSVLTTAPVAMNYRYVADHRFLLTPTSGARAVADAYSWNRTFIRQATAGMSGQLYRYQNRPSVSRDPGKKIDNTLSPDGLVRETPGSELNDALRDLRLPAIIGRSP